MPQAVVIADARTGLTNLETSLSIRLAATGRWQVSVLVPATGTTVEHSYLTKLLSSVPGVELAALDAPPRPAEVIFVRLHPQGASYDPRWKQQTRRLIGITNSPFAAGLRPVLAQLWRMGRQALACHLILAEARSLKWNPYRGLVPAVCYDTNPHPDFWLQPELQSRMAEPPPAPSQARRWRLMYSGAGSPVSRMEALAQIKPQAEALGDACFWRVYRDPNGPPAPPLSQIEYLDVLDESDFALSPPGWNPWTHRLVEVVSRLAIPIADAGECDAAGLRDGETAIFVQDHNWAAAARRALALSPDKVQQMRAALIPLAAEVSHPQRSGQRLCRYLGLA